MRDGSKTPLERAFEIARSGEVKNMVELKTRLSREGYEISQIEGASLTRQLRDAIVASPNSTSV